MDRENSTETEAWQGLGGFGSQIALGLNHSASHLAVWSCETSYLTSPNLSPFRLGQGSELPPKEDGFRDHDDV